MEPTLLGGVAHLTLQVGRLLLGSGADPVEVRESMVRFGAAFGFETHPAYEALLLTVEQFRTKFGYRVPATGRHAPGRSEIRSIKFCDRLSTHS